jgi:hypothetical protein
VRTGDITVSPRVPVERQYDVLVHELAHVSHGVVEPTLDGTLSKSDAERAADVRACEWGATSVHYVGECPSGQD